MIIIVFCNQENTYWQHTTSRKSFNQKSADSTSFFVANTLLAKSCNFTLKNLAKSCKFTLKKVAKSCKFAQKKMRKEYVTVSVYVSFLLKVRQRANCLLNNHPFICTAKPSSMMGLSSERISSGVTFCRFWAGVGRSMV